MSSIGAASRPRLARGVRLRVDRLTGKTLLLRPEQGFELRGSALEIVKLCLADDHPTVAEMVERLVSLHPGAARDDIQADVSRLLSDLVARGLMVVPVGRNDGDRSPGIPAEASSSRASPGLPEAVTETDTTAGGGVPPRPYTLIAELTYRCPLRCAYCSNPVRLQAMGPDLETDVWTRVFAEAERLGVMQVTLTGGEPLLRPDLEQLVATARAVGLYTTLITSGIPLEKDRLTRLRDAGLDGIQLSFQDDDAAAAARIAGMDALAEKIAVAGWIRELGLPLTLNIVLHRENLPHLPALIALAERLQADRLELAHVQYLGWALTNREVLLPTAAMIADARATVTEARARLAGQMEILAVLPDYFSDRPRACMDGWGQRYMVVAPDGRVLPCHAAHTIKGMTFDNVAARSLEDIWVSSSAFTRFRGEDWMPPPCRTCDQRAVDFGGCRCQAYHLTGDMAATDPTCVLSPHHDIVARAVAGVGGDKLIRLRRPPTAP